jgi:hypothetical protein
MALVPFGSSRKKASYTGASSPKSKGRMPKRMTDGTPNQTATATTKFEASLLGEVDGSVRGHDYGSDRVGDTPRKTREDY